MKVSSKERKNYYKRMQIAKYLAALTPDERLELSNKLDAIDKIEDEIERKKEEVTLQLWLTTKYIASIQTLCFKCSKKDTCKRNQEKVKSCKLYEEA